jgi:hypothetical protein
MSPERVVYDHFSIGALSPYHFATQHSVDCRNIHPANCRVVVAA